MDGQLLTAPYSRLGSILDLGCGSAVWTAAVAGQFPKADVVGIDITPPINNFGLDNLTLVTADVEKPWESTPTLKKCYDLISLRVLVSAISDWQLLSKRCFDHLNAGGWIEIPDITIGTFSDSLDWHDESSPLMRWYQCYRRGAATHGIDGFANRSRTACLQNAGFTRISERFFNCYLDPDTIQGGRDKEIARLTRQNMFGLLEAVSKTMEARGDWDVIGASKAELEQLQQEARDDMTRNAASRGYHWIL
ncbi:MAG: hypothetical protein Q9204_002756 [Flavoplaca sp. TL-2023a]